MVAVVTSGPPHVKSGVLLASCCVRSGPPGNHRQRVDGFRVTSHNRQDVGALPPPDSKSSCSVRPQDPLHQLSSSELLLFLRSVGAKQGAPILRKGPLDPLPPIGRPDDVRGVAMEQTH